MGMGRSSLVVLCLLALLAGCAVTARAGQPSFPTPAVRAEFQPACGHPGARVTVLAVPVVVAHAACDLVGVRLTYGLAGAVVPAHGTAEGHVETFAAATEPLSIVITVA